MILDETVAAVVTGGASGLGAATAQALAKKGVKVALFDRDVDKGQRHAEAIGGIFCEVDVTDEASITTALVRAREKHGIERILVNCAGIVTGSRTAGRKRDSGEIWSHDIEVFAQVININLIGTFHMASKSVAAMMSLDPVTSDGGRGVIINTSSVAATDGQMGQAAYAASKGGVASLSLPMARDLARDGIRVMGIMPGLFQTPMFDALPPDAQEALGAAVPFPQRLGKAEEYASLALHIIDNDMLNGENIRLDGAIRLAPR